MRKWALIDDVLKRERDYHEKLYSGFAQQHFAKPGVRALRAHMVQRILAVTGLGRHSRVLSLGCGIGDTELLLAPYVGEVVGIDLSPAAIRQARADADRLGVANARFVEGSMDAAEGSFDAAIAIFFLHHLPDEALAALPAAVARRLHPGASFYSLDPSRYRLSGMVGRILIPKTMAKYQTEDERELEPAAVCGLFGGAGWQARIGRYDFISSPLAGLFPASAAAYRAGRLLDEVLVRTPLLARFGSNFEIIARCP